MDKKRISWVEDDRDWQEAIEDDLGHLYDIKFKTSYERGLRIRDGDQDVIVSDFNISGSNTERTGVDLNLALRKKGVKEPFIYMTSTPDKVRGRKRNLGVEETNDVIDKSQYNAEDVFDILERNTT